MQKEAIESFNKALELDFELLEAHSDKGKSYLLLKNYPLAIECFNKALTNDTPRSRATRYLPKKLQLFLLKGFVGRFA